MKGEWGFMALLFRARTPQPWLVHAAGRLLSSLLTRTDERLTLATQLSRKKHLSIPSHIYIFL